MTRENPRGSAPKKRGGTDSEGVGLLGGVRGGLTRKCLEDTSIAIKGKQGNKHGNGGGGGKNIDRASAPNDPAILLGGTRAKKGT